jgi:hypothetical protein
MELRRFKSPVDSLDRILIRDTESHQITEILSVARPFNDANPESDSQIFTVEVGFNIVVRAGRPDVRLGRPEYQGVRAWRVFGGAGDRWRGFVSPTRRSIRPSRRDLGRGDFSSSGAAMPVFSVDPPDRTVLPAR